MSVDERIRAAFGGVDESWETRTGEALRRVGRRRAREVVVRRAATGGVLAATVAIGAVLVGGDLFDGRSASDPVGPPPTMPSQLESSPSGVTPSVLEGRWRTAQLDEDDLRAALDQTGNGQYADRALTALGSLPARLVWIVTLETAELRVVGGGTSEAIDKVELTVDDDRVTLSPRFAEGVSVHEFVITGDQLRLSFVSTTEGVQNGVPGEVWQRLLYDSVSFARR